MSYDQTPATWAPDGQCGDPMPAPPGRRRPTCTRPAGHDAHRSGGDAWTYLREPDLDTAQQLAMDAVALSHEHAKRAEQAELALRAEEAEASLQITSLTATIRRVRTLAEQWAAMAPENDWGEDIPATITADVGRAVLAALDQPGGAE